MRIVLIGCMILCLGLILTFGEIPALAASAPVNKEIPTLSGAEVLELVKNNKGKIIFLNFFATWCPPCREEIPELIALRKEYSEDKVLFVGISLDSASDKLERFVQNMDFTYPVYKAGPDVGPLFGIVSIPYNMAYSAAGELVASEAGMVNGKELKLFLDQLLQK